MKTVQQLLDDNHSPLGKLITKTKQLEQLNRIFQNLIDSSLAKHCQVAKFSKKQLVLIVDNAAFATRLRFAIPDILKNLRIQPEFHELKKINYSIAVVSETPAKKRPKKLLSNENQKLLQEMRNSLRKQTRSEGAKCFTRTG